MKVFISWSGTRSQNVAELLNEWLPCVLQAAKPWVSTKDLERGTVWFSEIYEQLKDAVVGIVCVTHENKNRPWVLFEAGALAKGLHTSRVCTFLVDLQNKDVDGPLSQFNHTTPERSSVFDLLTTLNKALGEEGLAPTILEKAFNNSWHEFETRFAACLETTVPLVAAQSRPAEDLLAEILENTRALVSRMVAPEKTRNAPEDEISESMRRRRNTLTLIEAKKMLKDGLTEEEVLGRLSAQEYPVEDLCWVMNRVHQFLVENSRQSEKKPPR